MHMRSSSTTPKPNNSNDNNNTASDKKTMTVAVEGETGDYVETDESEGIS